MAFRYFLDTQLYSYLANGTIRPDEWNARLGSRELGLSPVTAYELLEGLENASAHTCPISVAALQRAGVLQHRLLHWDLTSASEVVSWLNAVACDEAEGRRGGALHTPPASFYEARAAIARGRALFLAKMRAFMLDVMPHYRRLGDLLFSSEWLAAAGRDMEHNLDAAFVFQTSVLERTMRIRYNPEKHPSDYLDYLQLTFLRAPDLVFVTADRRLVRATLRSLDSPRIYAWDELRAAE